MDAPFVIVMWVDLTNKIAIQSAEIAIAGVFDDGDEEEKNGEI